MEDSRLIFVANQLHCKIENLPRTYLGLPLGRDPKLEIMKKLDRWNNFCLSRERRFTLCHSIITSIPLYDMFLYCMPRKM